MYLKIYCDYCGRTWEAYPRDDLTRSKASRCPHCNAAKIDPETWNEVVSVLMRTKRINEKLASDHVDKHNPLFAVSFIADHCFEAENMEG